MKIKIIKNIKKEFILFYILPLFLGLFAGQPVYGQQYQGAFHIIQKELKEQDDSLHLSFAIEVDSRAVDACSTIIFEPELRTDKDSVAVFPYMQINGEERSQLNRRWFRLADEKWLSQYQPPHIQIDITKYTGEELTYEFAIPYQQWMDDARLVLKQEIIHCGGEMHLFTYTLFNQVATAPREPYAVQPLVSLVAPKEEAKTRNRQGSAFLDFQVGRSVILPEFRRNPVELGKINDALVEVMGDADAQITGLFIEGYASPEGRYESNKRLAYDRALALRNYIKNHYLLPENILQARSLGEDWDGLRVAVENSDLPQKEQILSVVNSSADFDVREQNLKKLSVYSRLLRDIFPQLRRVEYQIDYAVRNYSNAEARSVLNTHPQNLSQAELYRVAESYGAESPEYRKIIMETIPQYFPDDDVAMSNAAALLIRNGEANTALRLLEKAQDSPAAWNNLGAAYLLRGDLDKAEELFNQASVAGIKEAAHNLNEVSLKRTDNLEQEKRNKR